MSRLPVLLSLCLCAGAVSAQPGQRSGAGEPPPSVREQRRVELREVLRTERPPGIESTTASNLPPPGPSRHLTPQERFELREQLRREQNESRRTLR